MSFGRLREKFVITGWVLEDSLSSSLAEGSLSSRCRKCADDDLLDERRWEEGLRTGLLKGLGLLDEGLDCLAAHSIVSLKDSLAAAVAAALVVVAAEDLGVWEMELRGPRFGRREGEPSSLWPYSVRADDFFSSGMTLRLGTERRLADCGLADMGRALGLVLEVLDSGERRGATFISLRTGVNSAAAAG
jgi:hypothetical protein